MTEPRTYPAPRIEHGFVIGWDWNTKKEVWLALDTIMEIVIDVGNSPRANRVFFKDGHKPHRDLFAGY